MYPSLSVVCGVCAAYAARPAYYAGNDGTHAGKPIRIFRRVYPAWCHTPMPFVFAELPTVESDGKPLQVSHTSNRMITLCSCNFYQSHRTQFLFFLLLSPLLVNKNVCSPSRYRDGGDGRRIVTPVKEATVHHRNGAGRIDAHSRSIDRFVPTIYSGINTRMVSHATNHHCNL